MHARLGVHAADRDGGTVNRWAFEISLGVALAVLTLIFGLVALLK
jgi:hypothetical protein